MTMDSFRIGDVAYDADSQTIDFYRDGRDEPYYWIRADRIDSYRRYNDWFDHLGAKRWFTPSVRCNFSDVLERLGHFGNFDGTESEPPYSRGL